jgi:hypothetical protein
MLFVHGFAAQQSYFSASGKALIAKSLPYLTQERPLPEHHDSQVVFALHYPAKKVPSISGADVDLPDPHGLSGTAVWDTKFFATQGRNWTPAQASMVGLVRAWDQGNQALICVKIEVVREFLVHALRQEAAYFRWLDRGSPEGDDLADWTWAEQRITDLRAP